MMNVDSTIDPNPWNTPWIGSPPAILSPQNDFGSTPYEPEKNADASKLSQSSPLKSPPSDDVHEAAAEEKEISFEKGFDATLAREEPSAVLSEKEEEMLEVLSNYKKDLDAFSASNVEADAPLVETNEEMLEVLNSYRNDLNLLKSQIQAKNDYGSSEEIRRILEENQRLAQENERLKKQVEELQSRAPTVVSENSQFIDALNIKNAEIARLRQIGLRASVDSRASEKIKKLSQEVKERESQIKELRDSRNKLENDVAALDEDKVFEVEEIVEEQLEVEDLVEEDLDVQDEKLAAEMDSATTPSLHADMPKSLSIEPMDDHHRIKPLKDAERDQIQILENQLQAFRQNAKDELDAMNELVFENEHLRNRLANVSNPLHLERETMRSRASRMGRSKSVGGISQRRDEAQKLKTLRSKTPAGLRRSSAARQLHTGDTVLIDNGRIGLVRWIGNPEFKPGMWVGMELLIGEGNHNGTVQGRRYFKCGSMRGIFVRKHKLLRNLTAENSVKYPRNAPRSALLKMAQIDLKKLLQPEMEPEDSDSALTEEKADPCGEFIYHLGDTLELEDGRIGIVKYKGESFDEIGIMTYGIDLVVGWGEHDGIMNGIRRFKAEKGRGLFVQDADIKRNLTYWYPMQYERKNIEPENLVAAEIGETLLTTNFVQMVKSVSYDTLDLSEMKKQFSVLNIWTMWRLACLGYMMAKSISCAHATMQVGLSLKKILQRIFPTLGIALVELPIYQSKQGTRWKRPTDGTGL